MGWQIDDFDAENDDCFKNSVAMGNQESLSMQCDYLYPSV